MIRFCWLVFLLCIGCIANECIAQSDTLAKKEKKVTFAGIVLPARSPENGWYLQGGGIALFKTDSKDTALRASNIYLYILASQLGQFRISGGGDLFTPKEKFYIYPWYFFSYWPELFFGLGTKVDPNASEFISYRLFHTLTNVYRNMGNKSFLGGSIHTEYLSALTYPMGGIFDQQVKQLDAYGILGFGPKWRKDTRDNVVSSNKGWLAEFSVRYYPTFNPAFHYVWSEMDIRYFKHVLPAKRHVWGTQFYTAFVDGQVPFRNIPTLSLRGYHPNIFRTQWVSWIQSEYRLALWRFIGMSTFVGLGAVGDSPSQYGDRSLLYSLGGGLRLRLIPKYNLNLRIEYGWGNGTSNFYVSFIDAF